MLKPDAIPTLHLPVDHTQNTTSTSAINRDKRMEAKLIKQVNCNCFIICGIRYNTSKFFYLFYLI